MENFAEWVAREISDRGWSVPEAARRSKQGGYKGISPSMIYKVINGHAKPGSKFYEGIARAFGMDKEAVLRKAGELKPEPKETASVREVVHLFGQLSDDDQERALVYLRAMLEHQREENQRGAKASQVVTGNALV